MKRAGIVIGVGIVGYVIWRLFAYSTSAPVAATIGAVQELGSNIVTAITGWSSNRIPALYRGSIEVAEQRYGLPTGMLGRLLYQESHYRDDIINGTTRSRVGALGIAQFMPATAAWLGVDPLDPFASIDASAKYLASLYKQSGTWAKALAAYNWGIGNVQRKGLAAAPSETVAYYTSILNDIGMAA